jgi:hypothetical protein
MMQKMRQAWEGQLNSMKQVHIESKEDIENLISRRELQINEKLEGMKTPYLLYRGTRFNRKE